MSSVHLYKDEELEFEHQFPHQLSCDVMELIFGFLNDWRSRIRFGAVCKSWKWVAQQYSCFKLGRTFGQLISIDYEGYHRHFFRFSDGGVTRTLHIPEALGLYHVGSSQGWLIMQKYDHYQNKLILFNPLSKARIRLPAIAKVKTGEYRILPMERIRKAILSSAPDQCKDEVDYSTCKDEVDHINGDCLVAALDVHGCLYICRANDRLWTKQYDDLSYEDVVFHERSIYGIDSSHKEYMVLRFSPDLNFKVKRFCLPVSRYKRSLVELCGKVVLVFGVCGENRSCGYRVCELESRDDGTGTCVESFSDGVLLLDHNSCIYLPIKDFNDKNLQDNCIYRTCSCSEFCYNNVYSSNGTGHFLKFEGGFRNSFQYTAHRDIVWDSPNVWFTPNIHI